MPCSLTSIIFHNVCLFLQRGAHNHCSNVLKSSIAFVLLSLSSAFTQASITFVYTSNQPDILLKKQVAHFPELGTLLKRLRSRNNSNVLFLHGGDSFSPSAISLFDHASNIVALANIMDVSLYSVGKRELTYDIDTLSIRSLEAQFPIVSSNVLDKRSGTTAEGLFSHYEFDIDNIIVSVASIASPRALITHAPEQAEIADTDEVLQRVMIQQKNADFKVLMTDLKMVDITKIADKYSFDIILSAIDGKDEIIQRGDTLIVNGGGQDGDAVVIEYNKLAETKLSAKVIDLSVFLPDPDIISFTSQYRDRLGKLFNEKIAVSKAMFTTQKQLIRTQETALANVFVDGLKDYSKADVAVINSGAIRNSEVYPPGYFFTREDIQQEFPFGSYYVQVEMTKEELYLMMENAVSRIEYADGRFMNVAGISVLYNSKDRVGKRVKSITMAGKELESDRVYTLAMQDFFLKGGDEYIMLKDKTPLNNLFSKRRIWHIVTDYMIKLQEIEAPTLNRLIDQAHQ